MKAISLQLRNQSTVKLFNQNIYIYTILSFTFTFMHLADAFIQSDLHCIQVTVFTF